MMAKGKRYGEWTCENVFCNSRDICMNWTNCMGCKIRARFLAFALANKPSEKTAWGRKILEARKDDT